MREHRKYGERREWVAPAGYGIAADEPVAGFYRVKLRGGSVATAVHLVYGPPNDPVTGEVMDRSFRWMAYLPDGSLADFNSVWPVCADEPITAEEYRTYCKRQEWARREASGSAFADPRKRYDPLSTQNPMPF